MTKGTGEKFILHSTLSSVLTEAADNGATANGDMHFLQALFWWYNSFCLGG